MRSIVYIYIYIGVYIYTHINGRKIKRVYLILESYFEFGATFGTVGNSLALI